MNEFIIFVFIFLFIKYVTPAHHPDVNSKTFCYDVTSCDPSTWSGTCKTGQEQSPININVNADIDFKQTRFFMNDHYLYERAHRFYAQNNGHTAQFELNPNTSALTSNLMIRGGNLNGIYIFAQLHFHWGEIDTEGSEHELNGRRYPMEVHLVHYKSIYSSLADALRSKNDREAVAVMAVFFEIGGHNSYLSPIIRTIHELREPGEVKEFDFLLRILDLYPNELEYGRYLGSLTTPTCDEKVIWTVFLKPLEISRGQIKQFRLLSNEEGYSDANYRPLQPLNGRNLEFYVAN